MARLRKGSGPVFQSQAAGTSCPSGAEQRHWVHRHAEGQGPPAQPLSQRKASQRKFPTWSQNWLPPWDSEKVLHKHIPEKKKYVGRFFFFFVVILQSLSLNSVWLFATMDCSTPGFPVLHYLLEFAQTHVHWISDAKRTNHVMIVMMLWEQIMLKCPSFSQNISIWKATLLLDCKAPWIIPWPPMPVYVCNSRRSESVLWTRAVSLLHLSFPKHWHSAPHSTMMMCT